MKSIICLTLLIGFTSCIPVKIAPQFKNKAYKIGSAKKFERQQANEMAFIFMDTKNEGDIYNYFNKKYNSNDINVGVNTPFVLHNETFYVTYKEVNRERKTVNLIPILVDAKRESNGNDPLLEDFHTSRKGYWYIVITVYDDEMQNVLKDKHPMKSKMITYLESLRVEYYNTANYEELLFEKKS